MLGVELTPCFAWPRGVSRCVGVSDDSLLALSQARCVRRLKWLDFSNCRRVSDVGLEPLTQRAQNIEHLNVACCRNLSFASLVTVRRRGRHSVRAGSSNSPTLSVL